MKKNIKRILLTALIIVSTVFCLTGCSNANVTTSVYVDDNFSGYKEIRIDLSGVGNYINGGASAVEQCIWDHQPEGTDFYLDEDNNNVVLSYYFNSLDEYRTKVSNALSAGGFEDEVLVTYENSDTIFKKGVIYKENFTTSDLIAWFKNAMVEDGVIEKGYSSNVSVNSPKVYINDEEIENYSSSISIDEQERTCFNNIYVFTSIADDGTYKRNIDFLISKSTKEKIDEEKDLTQYMKSLYIPDVDASESVNVNDYDSEINYNYYISGKTADELTEKTNTILQSNNNFSSELTLDEENVGHANLSIKEKIDGSYYLSSEYNNAKVSDVIPYRNIVKVKEYTASGIDSDSYSLDDGSFAIEASPGVEYNAELDWLISPANVQMTVKASSNGKTKVELEEMFSNTLDSSFVDSAEERLADYTSFGGQQSRNGNVVTISFDGDQYLVEKQISNFAKGAETEENNFSIDVAKGESGKIWQDATKFKINYDFSDVFGENTMIMYKETDGFFSSQKTIGNTIGSAGKSSIEVVELKISIIGYVLGIGGLATLIAGIVLLVLGRKDFKNIKIERKPKPVKVAAPQAPKATQAPKQAKNQASKETYHEDDEEDLL